MDQKLLLAAMKELKIRQCREDFWEFCKTLSPILPDGTRFFDDDKEYLMLLARELQATYEAGPERKGICISMPPRHGKSITTSFFNVWLIGKNNNIQIAYVSYSQDIVNDFSREIKRMLNIEENSGANRNLMGITYDDIFPGIIVARDQKKVAQWKITKSKMNFTLRTGSFRTSMTGKGLNIGIVDDPIKNSEEAMNEEELENKWNLFVNTFLSRGEGDAKWIIIQTRWSKNDIIGKIEQSEELKDKFKFINVKVAEEQEDGSLKMLNPQLFSEEQYKQQMMTMAPTIFNANYNQIIIDQDVALYKDIQFYSELPNKNYKIVAVLDPSADGKDYTACIVGNYYKDINKTYITNVLYDNTNINKLEDKLIDFIIRNGVEELIIEANSAFIILSNNIKKALIKRNFNCRIRDFKQTKNKAARIITAAKAVQEQIIFPEDFPIKNREVYNHLCDFRSIVSDNKHDDFEDALTLLWESFNKIKANKLINLTGRFYI